MKKVILIACLCIIAITVHVSAQSVKVQYICGEPTAFFYKIRPFLSVVNTGTADLNLSTVTMRYYYTKEGYVNQTITYDWVPMTGITATCQTGYLEVKFASGTLAPGAATGAMQLRIEKTGGGYFNQADDYSFAPEIVSLTDFARVTLYVSVTLAWGIDPPAPPAPTSPPPAGDDWLHVQGRNIFDAAGTQVRLTGINWFGFETDANGFYNFDFVNWRYALETMTARGFNLLRIPLSAAIVNEWRSGSDPAAKYINGKVNWDIDGITSLALLDLTIDYCKTVGMKIMFDMHNMVRSQNEAIWTPVANLTSAWQWLAARYKNDDTIIAMDLFNEPHGVAFASDPAQAKWDGSSDSNNWRKVAADVAQVILAQNPNVLIMVEGIEATPKAGYTYASTDKYTYDYNWWGGNLRGVADYPVNLGTYQNKLVYSPHDYGPDIYLQPWFVGGFDQARLIAECWRPNWFYIAEQNIAPILVGEWGGKLANADNKKWLDALAGFISTEGLNHTFWAFNPNSGDTGGIMLDDWVTVDEAKYTIVEKTLWKNSGGKYIGLDHTVNLGLTGSGTSIGGTVTTAPSADPTILPTAAPTESPTSPPTETVIPTAAPTDSPLDTPAPTDPAADTQGPTDAPTDTPAPTATPAPTTVPTTTPAGDTLAPTDSPADTESPTNPPVIGCTCSVKCDARISISVPFTNDGAGEYCWEMTSLGAYINSWNTDAVNVNGTNCTNTFVSSSSISAINGIYYVYCKASYSWSHIEIK